MRFLDSAPRRRVSRRQNAVELGSQTKFVVFFSDAIGTPKRSLSDQVVPRQPLKMRRTDSADAPVGTHFEQQSGSGDRRFSSGETPRAWRQMNEKVCDIGRRREPGERMTELTRGFP